MLILKAALLPKKVLAKDDFRDDTGSEIGAKQLIPCEEAPPLCQQYSWRRVVMNTCQPDTYEVSFQEPLRGMRFGFFETQNFELSATQKNGGNKRKKLHLVVKAVRAPNLTV